jgi:hypothetical protein
VLRRPLLAVSLLAFAASMVPCRAQNRSDSSKVGIGVTVSTLGVGGEVAVPITGKLNVRGGCNAISYSHTFNKDGTAYAGNLSWRSGEADLDWFPFAGRFHLSPGLLFYNGNKITANSSVAGGQTFTLNGASYMSSTSDPVHGTGNLGFNRVDPSFKLGFGNLVPRNGHHWSFLAEAGFAYQGSPNTALTLAGTACDPNTGTICVNAATDPTVQSNLAAEQSKINHDVSFFRFYPILSVGVGFAF